MTLYLGKNLISGTQTLVGKSYNIGQIIPSTIPLTDAGLHLLDGALIDGSGSYSAFVDYIADLYENTQVSGYKYNINTIGFLTNNNGVLSGFSTNNYAQIVQQVPLASANSFEFVSKFTYNTSTAIQSIFTERNVAYFSQISINASGELYCQLSNNHSSANIGSATGSTTLTSGNTYYVKLSFDGSVYKVYLSSTGEFSGEETEEISITSSARLLNFNWNIGCSALSGYEQPFNTGSIDLKKSYVNINGQRWWTGAEEIKPIFCTETQWQGAVTTYGVCGKFVYDSTNSTVRLPKYSNKIYTQEFDATAPVVGNGTVLGLTNGTTGVGVFSANSNGISLMETASDIYGQPVGTNAVTGRNNFGSLGVSSDPVYSGLIAQLSNITTSLDGYYYIVIATSTKTDIQVDIDQIATDLNGKADTDLSNVSNTSGFRKLIDIYNNGTSWYKVYAEYNPTTGDYIGKWCVQGGVATIANNTQITFAKHFVDVNYQGHITERVRTPFNSGQQNCRFYPTSTTYATCCSGLTGGVLCQWFAMGYIV